MGKNDPDARKCRYPFHLSQIENEMYEISTKCEDGCEACGLLVDRDSHVYWLLLHFNRVNVLKKTISIRGVMYRRSD